MCKLNKRLLDRNLTLIESISGLVNLTCHRDIDSPPLACNEPGCVTISNAHFSLLGLDALLPRTRSFAMEENIDS